MPSSNSTSRLPQIKVLLLHNIMAPYRYPLFKHLSQQKQVSLHVGFMSVSAKNRRWATGNQKLGFSYEVLKNWQLNFFGKDLFTYIINYDFPWKLWKSSFDVIITAGWLDFACQAAFFISRLQKRKFIMWCESTAGEPSWRRDLAKPLVRLMVSQANACIAVGTRSKEYLITLGAKPASIFTAYSTVDIKLFAKGRQLSTAEKNSLKKQHHISAKRNLLYVGQFIERKGIKYLLSAFQQLSSKHPDLGLILVGYGPQKAELTALVKDNSLQHVAFIDHLEPQSLAKIYGLADIFVLPSDEETWGLVVNEAMAAALPVVVSSAVGCASDLVLPGKTGLVFKHGQVKDLTTKLHTLLHNPKLRASMSKQAVRHIEHFTPEKAAQAFAAAISYATEKTI